MSNGHGATGGQGDRTVVGREEAAALCAVNLITIRRDLDAGRYPGAFKTATGVWRIPVADLIATGRYVPAPGVTVEDATGLTRVRRERDEACARVAELEQQLARLEERLACEREFRQSLHALIAGSLAAPSTAGEA